MYYYTDQVMVWMKEALALKPEFGFQYVDYGDPEDFIPGYPAVIITANPSSRILHATHRFQLQLSVDLWVLHADMTTATSLRRIDCILLCNAIQDFLDLNMNLPTIPSLTINDAMNHPDGNVIQGWISGQSPGLLRRKGAPIVGTRMTWEGISAQPFV